ncbi:UDP-galactose transporter senju-like [Clytia hemisphaerica]|uniref:Uncharacterized protein n=1 Tax=Clytia hemisphaerica TaxID=252671 RepID=A0A7M5XAJ8_9CNID|eukprot:TCONS_00027480-protein
MMPSLSDLKNLFPTKLHAIIFVGYMALFINQGILVTATKDKNNKYPYNPTTLVLLSECLKMVTAAVLYAKDDGISGVISGTVKYSRVLLWYLVPAFLYCLYNNLAFVNLQSYDPTSYFLLLQFRVVVTGVIFQVVFKKKLSRTQWFSLILLTLGCIIKQLNISGGSSSTSFNFALNFNFMLILVQIFCSCFAGVYNEYLLKGNKEDVPFMLQNVFMYMDSIVCNAIVLAYTGKLMGAFTPDAMQTILQPKVILIIINNAAIGIVTAMFLRSLNSILKTFASALELMFTAVLSWMLFGIPVNVLTAVAIAIVSYATLLYAQNPVDNTKPVNENREEDNSKV